MTFAAACAPSTGGGFVYLMKIKKFTLANNGARVHTTRRMNNKRASGIVYAAMGAVAFGMNPYFGIPLYAEGMEPLSVLFYRFALGSVLMGALLKARGESLRLERRYLLLTALVGLLLASTCFLWFMSFRIMDSGIGATLIFIYPIMVALMMWGLYGERPSGATMAGIVTALGGVALTCCPGSGARICAEGLIYLTLAALIYAIYFIIVRKSALRELSAGKLTFYAMVFTLPVFLVVLRGGYDLQMLPSLRAVGNAVGLAIFPSLLSFLLTTMAIRRIGPTQTSILGALEPLTAVVLGVVCFGEQLSLRSAAGIIIVLAAVTLVVCAGSRKKSAPEPAN